MMIWARLKLRAKLSYLVANVEILRWLYLKDLGHAYVTLVFLDDNTQLVDHSRL